MEITLVWTAVAVPQAVCCSVWRISLYHWLIITQDKDSLADLSAAITTDAADPHFKLVTCHSYTDNWLTTRPSMIVLTQKGGSYTKCPLVLKVGNYTSKELDRARAELLPLRSQFGFHLLLTISQ